MVRQLRLWVGAQDLVVLTKSPRWSARLAPEPAIWKFNPDYVSRPTVSVIIAARNADSTIAETLGSVCAQTFPLGKRSSSMTDRPTAPSKSPNPSPSASRIRLLPPAPAEWGGAQRRNRARTGRVAAFFGCGRHDRPPAFGETACQGPCSSGVRRHSLWLEAFASWRDPLWG